MIIKEYFLQYSEILVKIPNSQCCHYANIIWSEYFKDFLISIGDMETNGYNNNVPLLNSEPIDTILQEKNIVAKQRIE